MGFSRLPGSSAGAPLLIRQGICVGDSLTAEVAVIDASLERREHLLSLSLDAGERDPSDGDDRSTGLPSASEVSLRRGTGWPLSNLVVGAAAFFRIATRLEHDDARDLMLQ